MYRESTTNMGALKRITDEYFGKLLRKEDWLVLLPRKEEDIDIIDDYDLLNKCLSEDMSGYLRRILQEVVSLDFTFGGYTSLADVLNSLNVKVHICEGIKEYNSSDKYEFVEKAKKHWEQEFFDRPDLLNSMLERITKENAWINSARIRGRYLPEENVIELYPEEMMEEAGMRRGRIDYLILTTLVHETMHAYFDRPDNSKFPYAYFVEEPMAEFGMLLFFKETAQEACNYQSLRQWAYDDVKEKSSCYRYGVSLIDQYCDWNKSLRRYLEAYKYGISEFGMLDIDIDEKHVALPYPICEKDMTEYHKSYDSKYLSMVTINKVENEIKGMGLDVNGGKIMDSLYHQINHRYVEKKTEPTDEELTNIMIWLGINFKDDFHMVVCNFIYQFKYLFENYGFWDFHKFGLTFWAAFPEKDCESLYNHEGLIKVLSDKNHGHSDFYIKEGETIESVVKTIASEYFPWRIKGNKVVPITEIE